MKVNGKMIKRMVLLLKLMKMEFTKEISLITKKKAKEIISGLMVNLMTETGRII